MTKYQRRYTAEQLAEISRFAFGSEGPTVYEVRDGLVTQDAVWWWGEDGPTQTTVANDLGNLKEFPGVYSIGKPKIRPAKRKVGVPYDLYEYECEPGFTFRLPLGYHVRTIIE